MDAPHAMINTLLKTNSVQPVLRSSIVLPVILKDNALNVTKVSIQVKEHVLLAQSIV